MTKELVIVGEVDFREGSTSCTENPVIKLKRLLKSLENDHAVRVLADFKSTPKRFFEILARKEGLTLKIVREDEVSELLLIRK